MYQWSAGRSDEDQLVWNGLIQESPPAQVLIPHSKLPELVLWLRPGSKRVSGIKPRFPGRETDSSLNRRRLEVTSLRRWLWREASTAISPTRHSKRLCAYQPNAVCAGFRSRFKPIMCKPHFCGHWGKLNTD